jgi:hypothetical protein
MRNAGLCIGFTASKAGPPVMGARPIQEGQPPATVPDGEAHAISPSLVHDVLVTLCGEPVLHRTPRPFPIVAPDETLCRACLAASGGLA